MTTESSTNLLQTPEPAIAVSIGYKKAQLLVSFSGGETSAYMAQWLWRHKRNEYDMVFVFANTSQENEETLDFVQKCSDYFGFPVVWVEAVIHPQMSKGTTHKVVTRETAARDGSVFEAMIAKYGIPNPAEPFCNRELKLRAIQSYMRAIGWKKYHTAIGIRADEFDRMNPNYKKNRFYYPLIKDRHMTKPKINFWWSQQPFRLNLKGYEGNCKWCWKKSDKKLHQISVEHPEHFDFPRRMESKFENFIPDSRKKIRIERGGDELDLPKRFFRGKKSVEDIFKGERSGTVTDDSQNYDYQLDLFDLIEQEESCDIFSHCGG